MFQVKNSIQYQLMIDCFKLINHVKINYPLKNAFIFMLFPFPDTLSV